jgi:hypothetical protein
VLILLAFGCSSSSSGPETGTERRDGGSSSAKDASLAKDASPANDGPAKDLSFPADSAAPPFLSDPGSGGITQLQIQGSSLYWIGGYHRIVRASIDGTDAKTLFTASSKDAHTLAIEGLAVDESTIYYTYSGDKDYSDRGVYKLSLSAGSNPVRLTSTENPNTTIPGAISVAGDEIFYSESSAIRRVSKSGGTVTTMVADRGDPIDLSLVIMDGYLYFTMVGASQCDDLYRLPVDAALAAAVDGGAADGGATSAPEKVSLVPGRAQIRFAERMDRGFLYWRVNNTVYRTDGKSTAAEVFTAGTLLRPSDTGIGGSFLPYNGTMYWTLRSQLFAQDMSVVGIGTEKAYIGASEMVTDGTYLYLAQGSGIARLGL